MRAAGGVRNRGRHSVRQLSDGIRCCCVRWRGACEIVVGVAFGSCLMGQDVVARAAGAVRKSWQAQYFGDAISQLSKRIGCCRARDGGRAKSW